MDAFIEAVGLGGALAILAGLGALLGGAAGHWSRGGRGGRIVSGAIMGAILLPLAALATLIHVGVMLVGSIALAAAVLLGGFIG